MIQIVVQSIDISETIMTELVLKYAEILIKMTMKNILFDIITNN